MVLLDDDGSGEAYQVAMSADGSTIVWEVVGSDPNQLTRVWSQQDGVQTLPVEPAFLNNDRLDVNISADGSVIIGGNRTVKRWTHDGGLQNLNVATTNKFKSEVSDDGQVIAIARRVGNREIPVRWTADNGIAPLGEVPDHNITSINGISADGSVIVGVSRFATDPRDPSPASLWRWTADSGFVVLDEATPDTSYDGPCTYANRWLSADGRVLVGERTRNGVGEVYRWTPESGFVVLNAPGCVHDMTPDGTWVLGYSTGQDAWLWSEATGTRRLTDILIEQGDGSAIEEWTSGGGQRISADGRAIAGTWRNAHGRLEAFVAYLNPIAIPGDYNGNGQLDAEDLDVMAVGMVTNDARFDLDRDGDSDVQDRLDWINEKKHTWAGDSNLDGEFNTSDLVAVFTAGKYETPDAAGWASGDWNGDVRFNTSDLVFALIQGGYEHGPRATSPVPEPSSWLVMVVSGVICAFRYRR
jgi:uncharacterized membrane protein